MNQADLAHDLTIFKLEYDMFGEPSSPPNEEVAAKLAVLDEDEELSEEDARPWQLSGVDSDVILTRHFHSRAENVWEFTKIWDPYRYYVRRTSMYSVGNPLLYVYIYIYTYRYL